MNLNINFRINCFLYQNFENNNLSKLLIKLSKTKVFCADKRSTT